MAHLASGNSILNSKPSMKENHNRKQQKRVRHFNGVIGSSRRNAKSSGEINISLMWIFEDSINRKMRKIVIFHPWNIEWNRMETSWRDYLYTTHQTISSLKTYHHPPVKMMGEKKIWEGTGDGYLSARRTASRRHRGNGWPGSVHRSVETDEIRRMRQTLHLHNQYSLSGSYERLILFLIINLVRSTEWREKKGERREPLLETVPLKSKITLLANLQMWIISANIHIEKI